MHLYQNHRTFSLFLFFSLLSVTTSYSLFPKNHLLLPPTRKLGGDESLFCESWRFAVETNNVIGWSTIPSQCFDFVKNYINGDRYFSDSLIVAENSLEFAKSVNITGDGKDAWIFDVDETLLFNLHYYETHNYGWVLKLFTHLFGKICTFDCMRISVAIIDLEIGIISWEQNFTLFIFEFDWVFMIWSLSWDGSGKIWNHIDR